MKHALMISTSLAMILSFGACSKNEDTSGQSKQLAAAEMQTDAAFTAADLDGAIHPSSEWLGKQPTVINYWGTWCPPCRREIPDLVKVYDEYKSKGVALVSLAVNDEPAQVRAFAAQHDMDWVHLIAEEHHMSVFGPIRGVPTTIFFDKNGKEVTRLVGMQTYEDFQKAFEMILAG